MANFYVGEVLFETGGTIDTPGDIVVTSILDCAGTTGTAGQILSSTGTALLWTTAGAAGIPCSILTAKGDIVVATGASAPAALPIGTNGQILYACSSASTGLCWATPPAGAAAATPSVSGTVFGCANATNAVIGSGALSALTTGTCNTAIGVAAFPALTSGCYNIALGDSGGSTITSGCYNVAIGSGQSVLDPSGNCQLAIGPQLGFLWLSGDSTLAIKPGAGIMDCADSCGTAGQVLMSNGSNAVCWGNLPTVAAATPSVLGTVYACTPASSIGTLALGFGAAPSATGLFNTFLGASSGRLSSSGACNVAVGRNSLCGSAAASDNVAVGVDTLINASAGSANVAIGRAAMGGATGSNNVVIGCSAGAGGCLTTGSNNVLIGLCAQPASPTGSCQLALGFALGEYWLTGNSTKAIKPGAGIIDCAGSCGTNGQVLMSNGSNAICWAATPTTPDATPTVSGKVLGCTVLNNAFIGCTAGGANPTGIFNVGFGSGSLAATTTGCCNTGVGAGTLFSNVTGNFNTAVGGGALCGNTGSNNTAVGTIALGTNTSGNDNVAVGRAALGINTTGSGNTAVGLCAGNLISSGSNNVLIGCRVQVASATGSCQLAIGFSATDNWLTGTSTKAIKPGAGIIDCANSCGTNGQVLMSNGSNAVCWGTVSGGGGTVTSVIAGTGLTGGTITTSGTIALDTACVIQPSTLTAKGSLITATAVSTPTDLSVGSDGQVLTACSTCSTGLVWVTPAGASDATPTVAGTLKGCTNNAVCGTFLGCFSGGTTTGSGNTSVGYNSLSGVTGAAAFNTAVGPLAGLGITTGSYNVALGHEAQVSSPTGDCQLAIGFSGTDNWLTGDSTKAIKPGAGIIDCAASTGGAGQYLKSNGANAVCWGDLPYATPSAGGIVYGFWADNSDPYQQCGNLAYGPQALQTWFTNGDINTTRNTALGFKALGSAGASGNTTICNVAIGLCALSGASAPWRNVAIGAFAAQNGNPSQTVIIGNETAINFSGGNAVVIGSYAGSCLTSSYESILIGTYAGCKTTSACGNIFIGVASGWCNTTGGNNTFVGTCTGVNLTTGTGNVVIGYGGNTSSGTVNNEVTIFGGAATARFQGSATAWSFSSDVRKKENITALPVGLDFITDLQPRTYSWIETQEESAGFIAQEVDEVVEKYSADYLRLVNKDDPDSWMLAQTNLIPVLVKALQEVNEELQTLKKEFNDYRSTHP